VDGIDYSRLRIHPLGLTDLDQLMAIEVYSFPTPWKRSMYEHDLLSNNFSRFYCVKRWPENELTAYIGSWFIYNEAHIGTIATKREHRGLRLAEQLIAYTAFQALNERMEYIVLEVRASNQSAIRLYTRLWFEQVGLRRGYYTDTGEDALLMTCTKLAELTELLQIPEGSPA
jgi:[ribosomal protein S18]-alanine N-acetyltransferase